MRPGPVFLIVWVAWMLSWFLAALWTGRTVSRVPACSAVLYRVVILLGAVLLYYRISWLLHAGRLWHVRFAGAYALAAVTAAGLLFTWWARLYLGRLWSGSVTRKEDHRIVDSGPYGLVRHPIYTGLITATFASAIAEATVPALVGGCLIAIGLWLKARLEERFLAAELGTETYAAYRRRVPMLLPFGPTGP